MPVPDTLNGEWRVDPTRTVDQQSGLSSKFKPTGCLTVSVSTLIAYFSVIVEYYKKSF